MNGWLLLALLAFQGQGTKVDAPAPKVRIASDLKLKKSPTPESSKGSEKADHVPEAEAPKAEWRLPAPPAERQAAKGIESKFVKGLVIPRARTALESVPNYRVHVRLKSGRKFSGIVSRDFAFHQAVFAGAHHQSQIYKSSRQFAMAYADGMDGQVSLAWNQLAKLEVREILDSAGMRAMEEHRRTARLTRREQSRLTQLSQGTEEMQPSPETPDSPQLEDDDVEPSASTVPKSEFLARFPPEEGWGEEKKRALEWRRTIQGVFPSEEEQRFLDGYEQWLSDWEAWNKAVKAAELREQEASETPVESQPPVEPEQPTDVEESPADDTAEPKPRSRISTPRTRSSR